MPQMLMLSKGMINIWYKLCLSDYNAIWSNTIASLHRFISGMYTYKQGPAAHCTVSKLLAQTDGCHGAHGSDRDVHLDYICFGNFKHSLTLHMALFNGFAEIAAGGEIYIM